MGVAGAAAANSYNSNNSWNNTATFLQSNKYIDFFVQADGSPITIESLDYAVTLSASAPGTVTWGYSINGGAFTTTSTTPGSSAPSSVTTWDFTDATVGSGQSVEFRMWVWGTTSASGGVATSNGTGRIANVSDGDLILHYDIAVPEPSTISLIGFGLLGLLAFVRRRQA
ncbi:MAG TPA: PEP-CTERM sorting domain-containing protein [Verrucomicrobiae bacterium]|nr:PEP-CTERM sorting domain-containing protein [Verrucomicrobiae bacterium]